jgi:hypothetical protein
MALTSPGVEISIIDESQYIPAATNSVPYILLATAQNKVSGAGVGVASGTLKANANRVYLISSQRDLSATFGVPFFYKTTAGTPINGYELNEYGLLAAYSALGVSNRCYVQRVDIDLAELTATLVRPTGAPDNGDYWFDIASTNWGLFQWSQVTGAFTNKIPLIVNDATLLESASTVPLQSFGSIGDYAVVTATAVATSNPFYYKRNGPTNVQAPGWDQDGQSPDELYNSWVLVGSDEWKTSWPAIIAANTSTTLINGYSLIINGTTVAVGDGGTANTTLGFVQAINQAGITGVYAAYVNNRFELFADSTTTIGDSTDIGGGISIQGGNGSLLTTFGIAVGQYNAPTYLPAYSYDAPRWKSGQSVPAPTGSVWQKMNNVNLGVNFVVKRYNSILGAFVQQACPLYDTGNDAIYGLDPSGGGGNVPAGATFARWNALYSSPNATAAIEIYEKYAAGPTIVTGNVENPVFTIGNSFSIAATQPGTPNLFFATATLTGTTPADYCAAVSAAGVPYVTADVNSLGQIVYTHTLGGAITLTDLTGTPTTAAGFIVDVTPFCRPGSAPGRVFLSYWVGPPTFTYTASFNEPDQDPADGRYWYYSATNQADIMIQNNGAWCGYQTVTNDIRGDNLSDTNLTGPIFSATAPATQTDASLSPLEFGDLWIDTSDLENYPVIRRWTNVEGVPQWIQIDNTDQTTENGILFADIRWAANGTTNPINDPIPAISGTGGLLTSNYQDLDAPDPALYPQGMLLWNTRRGGFNVKTFEVDYFNSATFAVEPYNSATTYVYNDFVLYGGIIYVAKSTTFANLPTNTTYWSAIETNAWTTASGNRADGSPYMGRLAQRQLIVAALKEGIDTSTGIREEQRVFNLLACPQYPELTSNMVALNNERNNTAFVVADTPLRLNPTEVPDWATNNSGLGLPAEDGLTVGSAFCGTFYPSCTTTDLSGSTVVQPPSHMMVRTIIRSDEVAYPWLAPAGTRRGVVDNATQIGYINAATGEFESLGVNQGLRDVLYENRINPITFIPGVGITNFGNKTVTTLSSALDRINVARLVAFIRGRLESIAKQFLFEPNDQITRNEITNVITTMMIDLVAKRGIYDYLVVCDLTNNTPARIDRNELYVDIAIEPVKAVEFIYIPVRIKNTGEIASQSV